MKVTINPTEKPEQLKENLEKRVESVRVENGKLVAKTEDMKPLKKTPGVESFRCEGEEHEGLGGSPVDEKAYVKIESREDTVKAFLATIEGYSLVVLNTGREWDLRQLKKYNPDIKHLKQDRPEDFLGIKKTVSDIEGLEKIDIDLEGEDTELIYREMLT